MPRAQELPVAAWSRDMTLISEIPRNGTLIHYAFPSSASTILRYFLIANKVRITSFLYFFSSCWLLVMCFGQTRHVTVVATTAAHRSSAPVLSELMTVICRNTKRKHIWHTLTCHTRSSVQLLSDAHVTAKGVRADTYWATCSAIQGQFAFRWRLSQSNRHLALAKTNTLI